MSSKGGKGSHMEALLVVTVTQSNAQLHTAHYTVAHFQLLASVQCNQPVLWHCGSLY